MPDYFTDQITMQLTQRQLWRQIADCRPSPQCIPSALKCASQVKCSERSTRWNSVGTPSIMSQIDGRLIGIKSIKRHPDGCLALVGYEMRLV